MSGGAFADQLATLVPAGGDADGGNPGGAPAGGAAGADTAASGAPGRYRATLAEHWNCPLVPQGGVVAAVAAEAMRRELDAPDQPIRSLTTLFVTPVPAGPVTVDVDVVRRGRSLSQVRATLAPAGDDDGAGPRRAAGSGGAGGAVGQSVLAVFGRTRPGYAFADRTMPDVPPPEDCVSVRDPAPEGFERPDIRFWEHVDSRMAIGHLPWTDDPRTSSEIALWYRFDEPPRGPDGALDPLALVALSDTMMASLDERLGRPGWWAPSADLTVHLLAESRAEWVLAHLRTHRAGGGYASAEVSLWDPEAGLVAYGTQVLYFTFLDGSPPDGDVVV